MSWQTIMQTIIVALFVSLTGGLCLHFARVSRDNRKSAREKAEVTAKAETERARIADEQRERADEATRRAAEIVTKNRIEFRDAVDRVLRQLQPLANPVSVHGASLRAENLTMWISHFPQVLPEPKRREFEQAWKEYQHLRLPPTTFSRPGPGRNNAPDYSAGTAVLRAALLRLRSFAD